MSKENLLFGDDGNPFIEPVAPNGASFIIRDINDGSVYRTAYKCHVMIVGRDVLVPIIIFLDKTHYDNKGRLCIEPASFTLGIFKKEVRNLPMAWRPLGYVTNQGNLLRTKDANGKIRAYHFMLSHVLSSLKAAQQADSIAWVFDTATVPLNTML